MHKKKLILLGMLLVFCLVGQWLVKGSESEAPALTSEPSPGDSSPQEKENPAQEENWMQGTDDLHVNLTRQILIMIVFVSLAGIGIWWFARRFGRGIVGGKGKQIRIVETIPLGPRKTVHIIEAGRRRLLLGSTSESISFLADVTEARSIFL